MSCFSCINPRRKDVRNYDEDTALRSAHSVSGKRKAYGNGTGRGRRKEKARKSKQSTGIEGNAALSYSFSELASATQNFREANIIGKGGFGCVYKGRLDLGQIVAVKLLNPKGLQGKHEFLIEVLILSTLHHPHLVSSMGYCTDGDQRLIVYEYMPKGSLENHLFDVGPARDPLNWNTRVKIAIGTARGLEYLHNKVDPPVIYRDLKSSNILLDNDFNPKLSDFGLAKLGPVGDKTHVSTRVMGTYGYCAPDYARSGKLTPKSDIYSFGVVLLELITGRKAIESRKKPEDQNLTNWAHPWLKGRKRYTELADPLLEGRFPICPLQQAVSLTAMCLQEQAKFRPLIGNIVVALEYIASRADTSEAHHMCGPSTPPQSSPSSQRDSRLSSREKCKRVTFALKE